MEAQTSAAGKLLILFFFYPVGFGNLKEKIHLNLQAG